MSVKLIAVTTPVVDGRELSVGEFVAYVARISSERQDKTAESGKLLKFLIEHGHWSPFDHFYMSFEIKTTRAIAPQLLRHRSATFQEFSQRYARVTEDFKMPEMRMQAKKNRQGSTEYLYQNGEMIGRAEYLMTELAEVYNQMVDEGVAKECARAILPICVPTEIIMTNNLRGWYHFIQQRMDIHAQKEIRVIAERINETIQQLTQWNQWQ